MIHFYSLSWPLKLPVIHRAVFIEYKRFVDTLLPRRGENHARCCDSQVHGNRATCCIPWRYLFHGNYTHTHFSTFLSVLTENSGFISCAKWRTIARLLSLSFSLCFPRQFPRDLSTSLYFSSALHLQATLREYLCARLIIFTCDYNEACLSRRRAIFTVVGATARASRAPELQKRRNFHYYYPRGRITMLRIDYSIRLLFLWRNHLSAGADCWPLTLRKALVCYFTIFFLYYQCVWNAQQRSCFDCVLHTTQKLPTHGRTIRLERTMKKSRRDGIIEDATVAIVFYRAGDTAIVQGIALNKDPLSTYWAEAEAATHFCDKRCDNALLFSTPASAKEWKGFVDLGNCSTRI